MGVYEAFLSHGYTPIAGCFILDNPNKKWMMTGGSHISGNHHMFRFSPKMSWVPETSPFSIIFHLNKCRPSTLALNSGTQISYDPNKNTRESFWCKSLLNSSAPGYKESHPGDPPKHQNMVAGHSNTSNLIMITSGFHYIVIITVVIKFSWMLEIRFSSQLNLE